MADNFDVTAKIHNFAVVHPNAKIGKNVEIGPFTVIGENVEIDEGTIVGPSVVITGWTKIGKDCHIFQGASIGEEPQDLKFAGEKSYTVIGNRTKIHEFCTIHRATGEGEVTKIGDDCLLMAYVHVAHNCILGNNVIMANAAMVAGHVVVEDRAIIGGKAGVHQFVRVGKQSMISGMSRNIHDVVPYTIVDGFPARACGLNSVGIARAGIAPANRRQIKLAYRLLYRSGLRLKDAISAIEQEVESCPEVELTLQFLRTVDRGICRPAGHVDDKKQEDKSSEAEEVEESED